MIVTEKSVCGHVRHGNLRLTGRYGRRNEDYTPRSGARNTLRNPRFANRLISIILCSPQMPFTKETAHGSDSLIKHFHLECPI
jgi:hypothetical protein